MGSLCPHLSQAPPGGLGLRHGGVAHVPWPCPTTVHQTAWCPSVHYTPGSVPLSYPIQRGHCLRPQPPWVWPRDLIFESVSVLSKAVRSRLVVRALLLGGSEVRHGMGSVNVHIWPLAVRLHKTHPDTLLLKPPSSDDS